MAGSHTAGRLSPLPRRSHSRCGRVPYISREGPLVLGVRVRAPPPMRRGARLSSDSAASKRPHDDEVEPRGRWASYLARLVCECFARSIKLALQIVIRHLPRRARAKPCSGFTLISTPRAVWSGRSNVVTNAPATVACVEPGRWRTSLLSRGDGCVGGVRRCSLGCAGYGRGAARRGPSSSVV